MLDIWLKVVLLRLLRGLAVIRKICHVGSLSVTEVVVVAQIAAHFRIRLGALLSAYPAVILSHRSFAIELILIEMTSSVIWIAMSKWIRRDSGDLVLRWAFSLEQVLSHLGLLLGHQELLALVARVHKHGCTQLVQGAKLLIEQVLVPSAV